MAILFLIVNVTKLFIKEGTKQVLMMKASSMNILTSLWLPSLLGVVVAGIVFAALTGKMLPLVNSARASLVALLVVGMAMCASGIGQVGASGRWMSPMAILGYLLGAIILVIIISSFTGLKLPLIVGETQAIVAVGSLIAIKFVIATISFFFHWL